MLSVISLSFFSCSYLNGIPFIRDCSVYRCFTPGCLSCLCRHYNGKYGKQVLGSWITKCCMIPDLVCFTITNSQGVFPVTHAERRQKKQLKYRNKILGLHSFSSCVTNSLCNLQQIPLLHLCKILVMNLRFVKCWEIHRWKALYKLSVINVIHSVKWNLCWAKYCSVKFVFKVTYFTALREWRFCHCFQHINYI